MTSFEAQVTAHIKKYQRRLRVIAKESAQETVALAQHRDEDGGRMRVKTGFLRASIVGATGSMPSGESVNLNPKEKVTYDGKAISAALVKWNPELGETLYVGWTANYARAREYKDGFLRGAVEQWDGTVAIVAARVRQLI